MGSWLCCGVDYPKLIAGEADYLLYGHTNPWDHLPGTLMVREAGDAQNTASSEWPLTLAAAWQADPVTATATAGTPFTRKRAQALKEEGMDGVGRGTK